MVLKVILVLLGYAVVAILIAALVLRHLFETAEKDPSGGAGLAMLIALFFIGALTLLLAPPVVAAIVAFLTARELAVALFKLHAVCAACLLVEEFLFDRYRRSSLALYAFIMLAWLCAGSFVSGLLFMFAEPGERTVQLLTPRILKVMAASLLFALVTVTIGYRVKRTSSELLRKATRVQVYLLAYVTATLFYLTLVVSMARGGSASQAMQLALQYVLFVDAALVACFVLFHAALTGSGSTPSIPPPASAEALFAAARERTSERQVHFYSAVVEVVVIAGLVRLGMDVAGYDLGVATYVWCIASAVLITLVAYLPYYLGEMQLRDWLMDALAKVGPPAKPTIPERRSSLLEWLSALKKQGAGSSTGASESSVPATVMSPQEYIKRAKEEHTLIPDKDLLMVLPTVTWVFALLVTP